MDWFPNNFKICKNGGSTVNFENTFLFVKYRYWLLNMFKTIWGLFIISVQYVNILKRFEKFWKWGG